MNEIIIGTSNFNTVTELCKEAREHSKMITIIGYPGAGKTTALVLFQEKHQNVYYMCVSPSMSAKQFYARLLNILGFEGRDVGASLFDIINQVSQKLNYDTTKKLLIIDEAGKFKPKFMEYLHELRDNTHKTTGIILSGPEYFHDNMKSWRNKGIIGIPEFYRRINHWEYLSQPSKREVAAFCASHGIDDELFISELSNSVENYAEITNAIDSYLFQKKKSELKTTVKKQA